MPESQGQKPHEASLGFSELAKISQATTKKHRFLSGEVIPYPQLASKSLCHLSVWRRWPGLQVASGPVAKPFPSAWSPALLSKPSTLYTQLPHGALPNLSVLPPAL